MSAENQPASNEYEKEQMAEIMSLLAEMGVVEELRARDMRGKNAIVNPHAVAKLQEIHACLNKIVWKDGVTSVVFKQSPIGSHASILLTTDVFGTSKITFPIFKKVIEICDGIDICESILGDGIIQIAFHVHEYLLPIEGEFFHEEKA